MVSRRQLFGWAIAATVAPKVLLAEQPSVYLPGVVTINGLAPLQDRLMILEERVFAAYRAALEKEGRALERRILYGDPDDPHPFEGLVARIPASD